MSEQRCSLSKIGDWILDSGAARLTHPNGEQNRLTPKTLQVLLVLLEQPGVTVSRKDLLDQVWRSSYPSDYVVSRAIADLRAAFGEPAKSNRYIETVPKVGYRLIAKVSTFEQNRTEQIEPQQPSVSQISEQQLLITTITKWKYVGVVFLLISTLLFYLANQSQTTNEVILPAPTPVSSGPGLEHHSRISSDGEWIVFASLGRGDSDWDIYRQSLNGGAPQPVAISDAIEYGPALSPDDGEIAYVRIEKHRCEVVLQNLYQSEPQTLASCTTKFSTTVDWSPDGRHIAYTAAIEDAEGLRPIHLVDRQTGQITPLTYGVSTDGTDYYPRFSPDGSQLAFLRGVPKPDHRSHIFIIDLKTLQQRRISDIDSFNAGLSWLDRERLLYVISDSGHLETHLTNIHTGKTMELPLRDLFQPDYHRSNKVMSMTKIRNDSDITMLNLADHSATFIAESTSTDWQADLSPDGRWVAFVSTRTGSNQLWLASVSNGAIRQLSRFDNANISSPHWAPDSETLLFSVEQGNRRQLFTTHIIDGNISSIDTGRFEAVSGQWLSDKAIVFSCHDELKWKLCRLNTEKGNIETILDQHAYDPLTDEGENKVYFTQDKPGLWVLNLETREIQIVWADLPRTLGHGWTVYQNAVYYLRAAAQFGTAQIEKREFSSGETTVLHRGAIPGFNASLEISKDGGTLVFTSWRAAQDDIVMLKPVEFSAN